MNDGPLVWIERAVLALSAAVVTVITLQSEAEPAVRAVNWLAMVGLWYAFYLVEVMR